MTCRRTHREPSRLVRTIQSWQFSLKIALAWRRLAGFVLCVLWSATAQASTGDQAYQLVGHVIHAESRSGLAGATVRLAELGVSSVTARDGSFSLDGLPPGQFTLVVSHPDHIEQRIPVEIPGPGQLEVVMRAWPLFHESVTVTATPWMTERLEVAQSTTVIEAVDLHTRSGVSVGEAVAAVPGVRNISTGETGGVPMIRGQTNERIRVLSDGVPHDYYQFSRRHMPALEPYEAGTVEVIRGPASVLYGTQALGGLVNLVSRPLATAPGRDPVFRGDVLFGYAGNNESVTGYAQVEGGSGGFGGRASWTRRSAGNIGTPAGDLPNTGYDQRASQVEAGYEFAGGVLISGRYKYWENDLGFHVPPLPQFTLNLRNDLGGVQARIPTRWGEWELSANLSRNIRRAFPLGRAKGAKVDLQLDTELYRASLRQRPAGPVRGWIRLEHGRQENTSSGPVTLLPAFENRTWAIAIFEEVRLVRRQALDRLVLNLGLRYDHRQLDVPANPARGIPRDLSLTYGPVTASVGAVYRITPALSAGFSVGRGWRHPSEFELFADGPHDGAILYERGNPSLQEETAVNAEGVIRWDAGRVRGFASLFHSTFDNYIYQRLAGQSQGGLPESTFDQTDAVVRGMEARVAVDVTAHVTAFATGDLLRTRNEATGGRLPFTPPDRASFGARVHGFGRAGWTHPAVELRATWTGRGTIAGLDEPFPLDTDSYVLFDLGAGVQRQAGRAQLSFDLWVSNLTNKAYKDFLDTYKQYAFSAGRNIRLTTRLRF